MVDRSRISNLKIQIKGLRGRIQSHEAQNEIPDILLELVRYMDELELEVWELTEALRRQGESEVVEPN
jgi:hypothetical protein